MGEKHNPPTAFIVISKAEVIQNVMCNSQEWQFMFCFVPIMWGDERANMMFQELISEFGKEKFTV